MSPLPIMTRKFRTQLQMSLCIIRIFYGACTLGYILSGIYAPHSVFYAPIHHTEFTLLLIGGFMLLGGALLVVDGVAGVAVVFFPQIHILEAICNLAQKVRTWCFVPVAFSYLMITYSTIKLEDFDAQSSNVVIALTLLYALFGLLFSLHENVIVNERNRNKEDVCRKE